MPYPYHVSVAPLMRWWVALPVPTVWARNANNPFRLRWAAAAETWLARLGGRHHGYYKTHNTTDEKGRESHRTVAGGRDDDTPISGHVLRRARGEKWRG